MDPEIGITKEEIKYIVKNEIPSCIEDVLLRRLRVAFLDRTKPNLLVNFIASTLGVELGWSEEEKETKIKEFYEDYERYEF